MNPRRLVWWQPGWWRRAFEIPAPPPWDGESAGAQRLDWLAQQTVERGLAVPAVMLLESVRPLQGGASRLIPFFEPLCAPFADEVSPTRGTDWLRLLEHPAAVDWLIRRIEERGLRPAPGVGAAVGHREPTSAPGISAPVPGPATVPPRPEAMP
jgi:hypothetical protein